MACTVRFSSPTFAFESSKKLMKRPKFRHHRNQIHCSSPPSAEPSRGNRKDSENARGQAEPNVIIMERYANGTSKRYIFDKVQVSIFSEEKGVETNGFQGSHLAIVELSWLPGIVRDFILPAGFPGSVSDEYLEYMLLQFPTNVTAWICHALVTSSLLKAVGVGFSGTTAAASAAAIRWVTKDGIGAVGRLFIGGRFGNLFDDDPKQWRMYADFIGSAGSIFDLTTQLYPVYFLPLASLGNLTKAVARGLKDPSFRVIQNHFAISGNLGEVAAKEEVWEVSAQLLGLGLGILLLDAPGLSTSYPVLVVTWMTMRLLHLWLRYQSLSVLQFNSINLKRARMLVELHVKHSSVPGCADCNRRENILSWERFLKPRIIFGVCLKEMLGEDISVSKVKMLLKLFEKEKYVLVVNKQNKIDFEVFVTFKVGATSQAVLRSVWQTYWLHLNYKSDADCYDQIGQSLAELEDRFQNFMEKLKVGGWDTQKISLKVPKEHSIEEIGAV
ncbi:protein root UVB sensitive 5 isoform X1 [Rhododendron vialii]|uniref:protein root UVB sensitive 5 isoform X1 n=2 Tax=Rhododendron vialii TaxID=182163 RepID=UPI00265EAAA1|nr:protein root UVB sensitive 5 isoform X1 [Rhododendron vialii]